MDGVLHTDLPSGELVLVWRPGSDGLALAAKEADFPTEELIGLAERVDFPEE